MCTGLKCRSTLGFRSEFGVRCDSLEELLELGDVQTLCTFVRTCLLVVDEPKRWVEPQIWILRETLRNYVALCAGLYFFEVLPVSKVNLLIFDVILVQAIQ